MRRGVPSVTGVDIYKGRAGLFQCPYCLCLIENGREVVNCPSCRSLFHAECWLASDSGCVRRGCYGRLHIPQFFASSWKEVFGIIAICGLVAAIGGTIGGAVIATAARWVEDGPWFAGAIQASGLYGALVGTIGSLIYKVVYNSDWSWKRLLTAIAACGIMLAVVTGIWPGSTPWIAGILGITWYGIGALFCACVLDGVLKEEVLSNPSCLSLVAMLPIAVSGTWLAVLISIHADSGTGALLIGVSSLIIGCLMGAGFSFSQK
jgi:hypothetical protein